MSVGQLASKLQAVKVGGLTKNSAPAPYDVPVSEETWRTKLKKKIKKCCFKNNVAHALERC